MIDNIAEGLQISEQTYYYKLLCVTVGKLFKTSTVYYTSCIFCKA